MTMRPPSGLKLPLLKDLMCGYKAGANLLSAVLDVCSQEFSDMSFRAPRFALQLAFGILLAGISSAVSADKEMSVTQAEEQCSEIYRRTGGLFVPAKFAGRHGMAIFATTTNMVVLHSVEKEIHYPDARTIIHKDGQPIISGLDRPVYENFPFSCLGLPESEVLATTYDLTSVSDYLGFPLAGISGTPFLRQHAFRINLSALEFRVLTSPVKDAKGAPLQISWRKNIPYLAVTLPTIGSRDVMLSTAEYGVQLSPDRIQMLRRMGHIVPRELNSFSNSINLTDGRESLTKTESFLLRWLEIGGVRFVNVPCTASEEEHVGLDLLHYLDLTIDFPQSILWVSVADPGKLIQLPVSGVGLDAEYPNGSGVLVDGVESGSPAEEAGMKRGDELLTIDGVSTTLLARQKIAEIFSRGHGTIPLTFKRSGTMMQTSLKPRFHTTFPPDWKPEEPAFMPCQE